MANRVAPVGPESADEEAHPSAWWKVVCLTGVDYFSTLCYLPGIAALAAGALSPIATLLIVALSLFGMLPMYLRVAQESPHGQGSVAMLERLLPFWRGKFVVLGLLGFVATAWIVTITLSASDAAVHIAESPATPEAWEGMGLPITIGLILVLGGVFLLGFREAVTVAIPVVLAFLFLNAFAVVAAIQEIGADTTLLSDWTDVLSTDFGGPADIAWTAFLAFPLLVLGLSGFETGVSMMPLIKSSGATAEERLRSRIRNTRLMLTTAALIMSVYLIATTFVTTVLIPAEAFEEGGEANGRAMAFLAHELLGEGWGAAYDASSIAILWFAGASAMAGLINIVPRYLPAYGMAPDWTRAVRPVVMLYTGISIVVTIIFKASVDAQAGAYAAGILAMMLSAAFAVTVSARRRRSLRGTLMFGTVTLVMAYALVANIVDHVDGVVISAVFIVFVMTVSLISRVTRTTEVRTDRVEFDEAARGFVADTLKLDGRLTILASKPHGGDAAREYAAKEAEQRIFNAVPGTADILFLEIHVSDPSEFGAALRVEGHEVVGHRVLRASSPAVPNAIAAILLALRDGTHRRPECYFEWSEGSPFMHIVRYLVLGQGDTAPVVREILRKAEPQPSRRPGLHVGG